MKKANKFFLLVLVSYLFSQFSLDAFAAANDIQLPVPADTEYQGSDDSWHFLFAPYGWLSSIQGDVTVRRNTQHVHLPFKDVFKNLDFAGEAHIEGGYGPLTLMIDPTYLKLSTDVNTRILRTTLTSETTLIDAGAFYKILSTPTNRGYPHTSLELLGGARYLNVSNALNFRRLPLKVSSNVQLCAPIIGGRIKYDPTEKVHFWLRGDGGGFDVDNVRSTWGGTLGLGYTVHRHVDLGVAYRVLGIDFTTARSSENIVIYGPMLGIAFYS